jgi:sec-independent protein translocase protein TatC
METDTLPFPLFEQLEAFRQVLIKILLCAVVIFPVAFYFAPEVFELMVKYGCPPGFSLKYFSPFEPLIVRIKTAAVMTVFAGMPYMAWQLWGFVAPGLYRDEKTFLGALCLGSWAMFILGGALAFRFILPLMMDFSLSMSSDTLEPVIGFQAFAGLSGILIAGTGIMAQCPVVVLILIKSGVVGLDSLKRQRPVVVIVILILSALITPPDVISQLMLAVPAYILFELCLLFAGFKIIK